MNGYTVTITAAGDETGPQTTIQVDTSSGAARVVELTVRAANGAGIAPNQLPATGRSRSRSAEAAPSRRGRRSSEESTEPKKAGRAYRRMPEPNEVIDAFQQSGRVTAVAEHFGVPRHTATGWLRRLRRMGLLAPAGEES